MDWGKLLNGIGSAGDILSGKESYNSALRGQQANATANRQITSQDTQAKERNDLQKLMQQLQTAAEALQQDKQQQHQSGLQAGRLDFEGSQAMADRSLRERMQGTDIGARKELSILDNTAAMDRTVAPLRYEQQRLSDAGFYSPIPQWMSEKLGVPMGLTPAQAGVLGPAGINLASATDPQMTKAFGNTFTQLAAQQGQAEFLRNIGLGQPLQPGVGQVGPGGVPMRGPAAPSVRTPIAPRSGNY